MTLRRRLDRLEIRKAYSRKTPAAVLRLVVTPSASGPVVVAAMTRRAGEPWRHLDREPGETEPGFVARISERTDT